MPKKSQKIGKNILPEVEIQNISKNGLWMLINNQEFFIPFSQYPWFSQATVDQIYDVTFLHGKHLYWSKLDVDIEVDALKHPDAYPLRYNK